MRIGAAMVALVLVGCGASQEEVDALRKDLERVMAQARDARREAARAREAVDSLNLKAEVHAFMQSDPSLTSTSPFQALEARIRRAGRSFMMPISSADDAKPPFLQFKTAYRLQIDFVSGSGAAGAVGNRLEVSSPVESFVPLNLQPNEFNAYVIEEGQPLQIKTLRAPYSPPGSKKRKKKHAAPAPDAAVVFFRYLPAGGAEPPRVAYVRVTFLGPAGEGDAPPTDMPPEESGGEPAAEPAPEGDAMDFSVE